MIGGMAARIQISLKKLHVRWQETRWALVLALVGNTSYPDDTGFPNTSSITIDDEPSPGSFKVILPSKLNAISVICLCHIELKTYAYKVHCESMAWFRTIYPLTSAFCLLVILLATASVM